MTHGYHWHGAKGRRTRRRIRRGFMKPVNALKRPRRRGAIEKLETGDFWTRYHSRWSTFSYGKRIRKGWRRE